MLPGPVAGFFAGFTDGSARTVRITRNGKDNPREGGAEGDGNNHGWEPGRYRYIFRTRSMGWPCGTARARCCNPWERSTRGDLRIMNQELLEERSEIPHDQTAGGDGQKTQGTRPNPASVREPAGPTTTSATRTSQTDPNAVGNHHRVASAHRALEQMAEEASQGRHTGTIGVEIPIKDGKLGHLKRI